MSLRALPGGGCSALPPRLSASDNGVTLLLSVVSGDRLLDITGATARATVARETEPPTLTLPRMGGREGRGRAAVAIWLLVCCSLIFLMVVVGGITRLTLSG